MNNFSRRILINALVENPFYDHFWVDPLIYNQRAFNIFTRHTGEKWIPMQVDMEPDGKIYPHFNRDKLMPILYGMQIKFED